MKQRLRTDIRKVLHGIDPTVAHAKSMAVCMRLMGQPEFAHAKIIMIYLPLPTEVEVGPIALRGWQEEKTITAPKISWDQRHMLPLTIRSLDTGLVTVQKGLREPANGEPVPVELLDLVIVPGLAFDRKGNRLGRGAGFYDRFLASPYFHGTAVGLAFREQVVDELPTTDNDVPMNMLVTDEEVLRFKAPKSRAGKEAGR